MLSKFFQEILPDSSQEQSCKEGAMPAVGHFLKLLQERVENYMIPSSASIKRNEYTLMLHFGPNYNQTKLIQMIIGIYNGIPQPFEVFQCFAETSEEEVNLFMKRAARHPCHYLLLEVNNLPFKLQEVHSIFCTIPEILPIQGRNNYLWKTLVVGRLCDLQTSYYQLPHIQNA